MILHCNWRIFLTFSFIVLQLSSKNPTPQGLYTNTWILRHYTHYILSLTPHAGMNDTKDIVGRLMDVLLIPPLYYHHETDYITHSVFIYMTWEYCYV